MKGGGDLAIDRGEGHVAEAKEAGHRVREKVLALKMEEEPRAKECSW